MADSHSAPRLVIFDAFNTLVRPIAGCENTFAAALIAMGLEVSAAVMALLQSASEGLDHRQWSTSRDGYTRWTARTLTLNATDLLAASASHVIPALEQWHQAPMEQFPDVASCLSTLRSDGITVAVCSNWGWDLADDLARAGLSELVDIVVSSAQAGYRKPNENIYRTVLEAAGIPAGDAMFVGDNLQADVRGPQRAGIHSVLLDRADVGAAGYAVVSSLSKLAPYVRL
jgi:putative hydrolase of the HAD superfamily